MNIQTILVENVLSDVNMLAMLRGPRIESAHLRWLVPIRHAWMLYSSEIKPCGAHCIKIRDVH